MSNKELREKGRIAFKANYWACVLAALLLAIVLGATTTARTAGANSAANSAVPEEDISLTEIMDGLTEEEQRTVITAVVTILVIVTVIGILVRIFLYNPLQVGCYRFFRKNTENYPVRLGVIKQGFGNYGHTTWTLLLRDIFLFLWTLLFIVPGLIKAYSYRLVPYLIKDNPELSAKEAIKLSDTMMKGKKGQAFLLDLSFIGWFFLSVLTLGLVGIFWTNPYYESSAAAFYIDVKSNQQ